MFLLIILYPFNMEMNMAIAQVIKELRKEKSISQEKLADAIDSHQVYISEIEMGKKIPSITILHNIAICFDMSLTKLIERIESKLDT